MARGERIYEETLGEKREYVARLLAEFEGVLSTQDTRIIKEYTDKLSDKLDELERFY